MNRRARIAVIIAVISILSADALGQPAPRNRQHQSGRSKRYKVGKKRPAANEPFATFRSLDQQFTKMNNAIAEANRNTGSKLDPTFWNSFALAMDRDAAGIEIAAVRLRRRYRSRPFAVRLFGDLVKRAAAIRTAVRKIKLAQDSESMKRNNAAAQSSVVSANLTFSNIADGYAALQCHPRQWTCCEPKRSESSKTGPPDACRWMCTDAAGRCRGMLGPRASH
jgi:hypothetical protein